MNRCDQEMCERWTGDGCFCAVMDGDPEAVEEFTGWLDEMAEIAEGSE